MALDSAVECSIEWALHMFRGLIFLYNWPLLCISNRCQGKLLFFNLWFTSVTLQVVRSLIALVAKRCELICNNLQYKETSQAVQWEDVFNINFYIFGEDETFDYWLKAELLSPAKKRKREWENSEEEVSESKRNTWILTTLLQKTDMKLT